MHLIRITNIVNNVKCKEVRQSFRLQNDCLKFI